MNYKTEARPSFLIVAAIIIVFLATGASGLIYQVVWQRYFLNVFGATLYSISAVLSAFMGGLALGSWISGRFLTRLRHPLAIYGLMELFVGLSALCVPTMLKGLDPVFTATYQRFGAHFITYSWIRFAYVFCILLIPTTLMGATLPLLTHYLGRHSPARAGRLAGLLYSANTAGAVVGAFFAGFYFIRWWGVSHSVMFAAALNVVAALVAWSIWGIFRSSSAAQEIEPDNLPLPSFEAPLPMGRNTMKWIYIAYLLSGFAALGLEIVWSRALVFRFDTLKNTTYAFSAMLTTFLVGIAFGSALITPLVNRVRYTMRVFGLLLILIGISSLFSFFALYYLTPNLGSEFFTTLSGQPGQIRWNQAVMVVFLRTATVMLLPTILMGMAFPVAVKVVVENNLHPGRAVGSLYSVNTIGAILGSALTGFVLLPGIGIAGTIALLAAMQLIAGVGILIVEPEGEKSRKITWGVLAAVAMAVALWRMPRPAIFQEIGPLETAVFYKEGPLATVSVLQNSLGYRTIYVDNVGVAGTDPMLLTDQKSLAHVPMLFLKHPKSALTVGFGSGGASYSYSLYPELEKIRCVEITKTVPQAAPFLQASNKGIIYSTDQKLKPAQQWIGGKLWDEQAGKIKLMPAWDDELDGSMFKADPRYGIILDDARSYLRFTRDRYDIIATDCTDLRYKSNANLYDLQYFQLCRDRINDDGMVVVWMPLGGLSDSAMKVALRTFYTVFPEMEVFYLNNQPTHYVLLLGTKHPLQIDVNDIRRRLAIRKVSDDLAEIKLNDPAKIISCFVTGEKMMKSYLDSNPVRALNTEDTPYLEFESPRYGYGDEPLLDNLDELFRYEGDAKSIVKPGSGGTTFSAQLDKYRQALPFIIEGHRQYREIHLAAACREYLKALKINSDDSAVNDLLNFDELKRKAQGQPDSEWAYFMLGELMAMQERNSEAVTYLNTFIQVMDNDPDSQSQISTSHNTAASERIAHLYSMRKGALLTLSDIYQKAGQTTKAADYSRQATAITEPDFRKKEGF